MAHWGSYGYGYLWCPGVETMEKTVAFRTKLVQMKALLSFLPHSFCLPLAELEGKMPLAADEV